MWHSPSAVSSLFLHLSFPSTVPSRAVTLLHLASLPTPTPRSLKEVEQCLLPLPEMPRESQMELEGVGNGGLWTGGSGKASSTI